MVRLKEKIIKSVAELDGISIPYGAIKRNLFFMISIEEVIFQFLMVRLKVTAVIIAEFMKITFQFLMVRLKVFKH